MIPGCGNEARVGYRSKELSHTQVYGNPMHMVSLIIILV